MKVAPDILILLDRSGSMNDDVNNQMCRPDGGVGAAMGCGASSKWAQVTPAIMQVVSETQADVNWGLKFFPDNSTNTCNVSTTAAVDIAPQNAPRSARQSWGRPARTAASMGYNGTPTRSAETRRDDLPADADRREPEVSSSSRPTGCRPARAQRLDADDFGGRATRRGSGADGRHQDVRRRHLTGGTADATLSKMADAGGLARTGTTPSYYPVSSTADLAAAIRTLIGVAATCTFQIGPNPSTTAPPAWTRSTCWATATRSAAT